MKILRLVSCGLSALVFSSHAAAAGSLTGQWTGLAPDGLVFAPSSGFCSANVTLNLTEAGTSLSGTFTVTAQNSPDGCVVPSSLTGKELSTGQIGPAQVSGTEGAGTLSFSIIVANFLHGVPVSFSAIVASGTFSASQLTATGTLIPKRAWNDANGNHVPDCNLLNPKANGECAAWTSPTTQSITLTAAHANVTAAGNHSDSCNPNGTTVDGAVTPPVCIFSRCRCHVQYSVNSALSDPVPCPGS